MSYVMIKMRKVSPGVYFGLYDGLNLSDTKKVVRPVIKKRKSVTPSPPPIEDTYNVFFGENNTDNDGIYFLFENNMYIQPENT